MTILALVILTLAVARYVLLRPTRNHPVHRSLTHRIQSAADLDHRSDHWITA